MKFSTLGFILATSKAGIAYPSSRSAEGVALSKRDPCDSINAMPLLYFEYREVDCPAPVHMDTNGICFDPNGICFGAFCQIRTNFFYGQEVPFNGQYCIGPFTCTITDITTTTYTITGSTNAGFDITKALKAGISGGVSWAKATAHAQAWQIKLNDGECSGTYSSRAHNGDWCVENGSTGNYCDLSARLNGNGSPDAQIVFVRTDCITRAPSPPELQNPIYNQPGVPMDRGALDALIQQWEAPPQYDPITYRSVSGTAE